MFKYTEILEMAKSEHSTSLLRILLLILQRRISFNYGWYVATNHVGIYLFYDNSETTEQEIYLTKSEGLKLIGENLFITIDGYLIDTTEWYTFNVNKLRRI